MASTQIYLNKIAFWQKLSAIVVSIIGLSLLGIFSWFMLEDLNRASWNGSPRELEPFLLFMWGCFFAFCAVCIFLTVMLWRSAAALGRYRLRGVVTDLEQAFRFQRYFWIGGTIIIGCILILVLFTMIGF